jgi:thiamine biosynthesis lipoprotein
LRAERGPRGAGVATSGSYLRGTHIYNPHATDAGTGNIVSLTVIGPDILEADRFATAAFAMGEAGIEFLERLHGLEGYQIDAHGMARMTSGLGNYLS